MYFFLEVLGVGLDPVVQCVGWAADVARKCPIHDHLVKGVEGLKFWSYVAKPFVIGSPSNAVAKYEQRVCRFGGACITNEDA